MPELKRFESYKMKVEARYKDFLPIIFELEVKYLSNLDGKIKYVDLGTHIFYKSNKNPRIKRLPFFKIDCVTVVLLY